MAITNTINVIEKIKQLKANRIANEQLAIKELTSGYSVDLSEAWEMLDDLAIKSKAIWDDIKGGKQQVQNSYNANFAGHAGELTAMTYYMTKCKNVEAPDLNAYMQRIQETSEYDLIADGRNIQVKCISKLQSSRFQVTTYNTNKYSTDGTDEVCFVYVDKEAKKGYVYGLSTPQEMLVDNSVEPNDQNKPCYSAKNVLH
ncbi:hypothetical protein [Moritella viscosa]|uniref:hypothetical protein n=1 Tax=Moritella viscosa TaxID=80854 RepID=UPI0009215282|nr:hypothetical protein [Moritella viscosa]SGZ09803.1 tRNA pseudouridine synthase B-tRNA pseudouridine(55) synthase-tRNA pseudouridylate synthase-tRNA-uridine isomerase [Moritella viscosa]